MAESSATEAAKTGGPPMLLHQQSQEPFNAQSNTPLLPYLGGEVVVPQVLSSKRISDLRYLASNELDLPCRSNAKQMTSTLVRPPFTFNGLILSPSKSV